MVPKEPPAAEETHLPTLEIMRDRFVFVPASGMFFSVSREGAWILSRLKQGESEAETIADLTRTFGISRGTAQRDVDQFIQRLRKLGLMPQEAGA